MAYIPLLASSKGPDIKEISGTGLIFCVFLLIHYAIKVRKDAPGALQHIICHGIEHRKIFTDTADKNNFVARLGLVIGVRLFNGYVNLEG